MEEKKKISKKTKIIVTVQLILVVTSLSFVYFLGPDLKYPQNNAMIGENSINFKFRNVNVILIDDNPEFASPLEINLSMANISNLVFEPGTYYWKGIGILESSAKKFTINSEAGLELNEENSTLKNSGNVPLNVSKENAGKIEGLAILDIQVEYPLNKTENKTIYRGEQYGK